MNQKGEKLRVVSSDDLLLEEIEMSLRVESPLSKDMESLIHRVIGAAIEVHRLLGPGFLESIYEKALCHEFDIQKIGYERQKEILVPYKEFDLTGQRLDLLVEGKLILELKAVEALATIHEVQLLSYLRSMKLKAGLLMNFNVTHLKSGIRRILL